MSVTTYCAWSDVTNRIGTEGAEFRTDDDPATQTDVLESAALEVNQYLQSRYEPTALATSNIVKFITRDIAVYLLCLRRNLPPPASVEERYKAALERLAKIESGAARVPDIYESKASVPVLSNQRVQMWPFPMVKTVVQKSTGQQENYPAQNDNTDANDYGS